MVQFFARVDLPNEEKFFCGGWLAHLRAARTWLLALIASLHSASCRDDTSDKANRKMIPATLFVSALPTARAAALENDVAEVQARVLTG